VVVEIVTVSLGIITIAWTHYRIITMFQDEATQWNSV
jgi:hypothetical protein